MQPPGNDEVCILGTLPADCEKLLREDGEGEWVVTLDGVSVAGGLSSSNKHAESTSGQLVIAADAQLRFSSARRGHVWEAQVAPVVDGDHPVEGRLVMDGVVEHLSLHRSVCIKEDTWKQHSSVVAPPAPTVAKTDSPKAAVEASSSAPADASATLPACMEQLALFLAPAPRSGPQLLKHLQQCRREDVVAAIQRLTAPPRGSAGKGARDLNVEGFVLINIEAFASSEERRKVADRAFNALISAFQSSQGPTPPRTKSVYLEKLHAMEPYADRDLILAAHRGAGGGIMAGLRTTTAKRSREATNSGDDDDDDVSHEGSGSDEDQRGDAQRLTAAQFMDMSQCDVRWEDGDLRTPARMMCEDGSQVAVLDAAKAAVPAPVDDDDGRVGLEAMPITTGEQLRNAQHRYTHLLQILHSLEDVVQKHKVITSRGIEWCLRHEKRMSPALREQLRSWWEEQKAPRLEYAQWRQYVHDAAYELERDIADFVQLHDYGIV